MKQVAEKLRKVEKAFSKERGPFDLFAIFLRDDAPGVWDLVVAADWIEKDKLQALRVISERVQQDLAIEDLMKISRVVIIDKANPALQDVTSACGVKHGFAEVKNSTFFGLEIKEAIFITSRNRKAA